MITTLQQDCVRLNERQDRILALFGRLVHSKYEINRGGDHSSSSSSLSFSTNNGKSEERGKAEVYHDMKWKPLVEAHQKLVASIASSSSSSHFRYSNVQPTPYHSSFSPNLASSSLSFSLPSSSASQAVKLSLPGSLSVLSTISPTVSSNASTSSTPALVFK